MFRKREVGIAQSTQFLTNLVHSVAKKKKEPFRFEIVPRIRPCLMSDELLDSLSNCVVNDL